MRRMASCRMGLLTVAAMCAGLVAGAPAGAARPVAEPLPFGAVDQVWTDVVHQFAEGPGCDGTGDAGGRFNVIHRAVDGPQYFKAWFLGDRFVLVRYRERPQSEPPTETPLVAWLGQVADDGRLQVEETLDGGAFADVCSWLMGRDV